jgi:hypothetical protein
MLIDVWHRSKSRGGSSSDVLFPPSAVAPAAKFVNATTPDDRAAMLATRGTGKSTMSRGGRPA